MRSEIMGVLIQLTRPTTLTPVRPVSEGDAEILFFTGVRYYRMTDEESEALPHFGSRFSHDDDGSDAARPDHA
jgi:hypothetical protein